MGDGVNNIFLHYISEISEKYVKNKTVSHPQSERSTACAAPLSKYLYRRQGYVLSLASHGVWSTVYTILIICKPILRN